MIKREEAIENTKEVIDYLKFEVQIESQESEAYFYAEINKLKKVLEFLES